eukprot:NODE_42_length_34079_cov_0.552619.p21 type:complete len:127 gc:universal NODE_42_length_34079_cov_0.552619:15478-15858(+)
MEDIWYEVYKFLSFQEMKRLGDSSVIPQAYKYLQNCKLFQFSLGEVIPKKHLLLNMLEREKVLVTGKFVTNCFYGAKFDCHDSVAIICSTFNSKSFKKIKNLLSYLGFYSGQIKENNLVEKTKTGA